MQLALSSTNSVRSDSLSDYSEQKLSASRGSTPLLATKRRKNNKMRKPKGHRMTLTILLAAGLLAGCTSNEADDPISDAPEIRLIPNVWQVMEGTKAATFDTSGTITSGDFTTYAFVNGSTDVYINGSEVDWNSSSSQWEFADGKHYWPVSGALNFVAHMPATLSRTYCSFDTTPYDATENPDGYSDGQPRLMCSNLPMNFSVSDGDDTQELLVAYTPNQSKTSPGQAGVTLNFMHPFARIKLQLAANHPAIHINSITFKELRNNGICTFGSSTLNWTSSGSSENLVITVNDSFDKQASVTPIGAAYLVIPQSWAGDIEVNASWTDWGEQFAHNVSTKISPVDWQPGYSYTYTFTITETDLKVDIEKYTEQW